MIVKYEASTAMGITLIVTFVIRRAKESQGEVLWIYSYNARGVLVQADGRVEKGAIIHKVRFFYSI